MRGLSVMPPAEERPIVARTAEEEKKEETRPVEFLFPDRFQVRHQLPGGPQARHAYRDVDQEYPVPGSVLYDDTAQHRPQKGAQQRRNRYNVQDIDEHGAG